MDWNKLEKNWTEMQWTKLTDEQLKTIAEKRTKLVNSIQNTSAIKSDETKKQV